MVRLFKGVSGPREFLSTPREWHALLCGFFEVVVPWPPRYRLDRYSGDFLTMDYHYYHFGRFLGLPVLIAWLYQVYIIFVG